LDACRARRTMAPDSVWDAEGRDPKLRAVRSCAAAGLAGHVSHDHICPLHPLRLSAGVNNVAKSFQNERVSCMLLPLEVQRRKFPLYPGHDLNPASANGTLRNEAATGEKTIQHAGTFAEICPRRHRIGSELNLAGYALAGNSSRQRAR
jgi:hypothetical protein